MLKITPKNILFLIAYSIPNTIFSLGILYIINNVVSGNEEFLKDYMGIVFVSIVIYAYLLNIIFQKKLNKFSYDLLYDNEKKIFQKILSTPLTTLNKLGSQRFYTAIEDLRTFSMLPEIVTHTINSVLMIILCIVYLFTLSIYSALIVLILIIVISSAYFIIIKMMSKDVEDLRKYNEHYYKYVDDVIKGFKELKINVIRRLNLMDKYLIPNREGAKELDFNINFVFLSINLISQYGLYLVIAVILFLLPMVGFLNKADVLSYVLILLFISGPINNLINMQNIYTRFIVANRRINLFVKDYNNNECQNKPVNINEQQFDSIEFKEISFEYQDNKSEKGFALGPLDFKMQKGETIFIVGGNGSGKSTFMNILSGLYKPSKGEINLNNKPISSSLELQNLIAAVFTDNHIFSHNYDNYFLESNKKYHDLLKLMELEKIVDDDKEESARRSFSKGQSKRMSMILALLEDRPILLLDEWAADQDPYFRKYFYEFILPGLKKEGKTIIAITHDDLYFKHADRILKFDYGKIIKDLKITNQTEIENLWH